MKLEFGKNYRVVGLGEADSFIKGGDEILGFIVTPLNKEEAEKYNDFYALFLPGKSSFGDGWQGDFKVMSVPYESMEYAKEQETEPGNWISFVDVFLEEV